MYYVYGTKLKGKRLGYVGYPIECGQCRRVYPEVLVKFTKWAHLDYIPLFPIKSSYFLMCPVCGERREITSAQAKELKRANACVQITNLEYYSKRILANKPKGLLAEDRSYEYWMYDHNLGGEICLGRELTSEEVKNITMNLGLKKVPCNKVG